MYRSNSAITEETEGLFGLSATEAYLEHMVPFKDLIKE